MQSLLDEFRGHSGQDLALMYDTLKTKQLSAWEVSLKFPPKRPCGFDLCLEHDEIIAEMLSYVYDVDPLIIKQKVFTKKRFIEMHDSFFKVFDYDMRTKYHFVDNPNERQLSMVFVAVFLQEPREEGRPV